MKNTYQHYLDSQSETDMANSVSVEAFLRGLDIQAAETDSTFAIIAPTWKMSTRCTLENLLPDFYDSDLRAQALTDFACVPVYSINPFFKNPALIFSHAIPGRICPIEDSLSISDLPAVLAQFIPSPHTLYFFASDYSVSADSLGIALICMHPLIPDSFELVLSKQIRVSKDREADYEAVENLIRSLARRGFNISYIGFDQYQSHRSKQILEGFGFRVEIVKYQDSFAAQVTLKDLIVTGKLIYGACDEVFMGEAAELQIINQKRIDHLSSGGVFNSKDVWDAVVNALKLCMDSPPEFVMEFA